MATVSSRQFVKQVLHQRSFHRQDLRGALFSECDLRGCNFQAANLQGATFDTCRVGIAPQRLAIALIIVVLGALTMFHAVSTMLLGSIGTLPGNAAWPYVLALYIALAVAGTNAGLQTLQQPLAHPASLLTGGATGALLGFFYGGIWTDNNPTVAVISAVGVSFLGMLIVQRWFTSLSTTILGMLGAIAAYGLAFGLWTTASSYLTTGNWGWGLTWGWIAFVYLGVALRSGGYSLRSLHQFATTSFRKANLTDCTFTQTDWRQCDLGEAIGQFFT
ncbi:MAG: pentapeptide repeat-containing protein [Cyanobacteria bacterium P01_H01_bin.58]